MLVQRLKLALGPAGWRLLESTCRHQTTPLAAGPVAAPVIFACLHRDILPAMLYCRSARPCLLISKSPDGEILVRTLAHCGFGFVRGSTGHAGHEGFVGLLRELRAGNHVGVAVDGPRGPSGRVHDGVLQLARRAGVPILPLVARCGRPLVLSTWDRTRVPLPFSGFAVVAKEPVRIPKDADEATMEAARRLLGDRLEVPRGDR
jgi:lysophospholipid acyltransferase (LPLAT)-like uncharacterized protein